MIEAYMQLIEEFKSMWEDCRTVVNMEEDQWMSVSLRDGWESEVKPHKIYPLTVHNRTVMNDQFDKLHEVGKMR